MKVWPGIVAPRRGEGAEGSLGRGDARRGGGPTSVRATFPRISEEKFINFYHNNPVNPLGHSDQSTRARCWYPKPDADAKGKGEVHSARGAYLRRAINRIPKVTRLHGRRCLLPQQGLLEYK